ESTGTNTKRFSGVGVESTDETRRDYRELLLATPGISDFISGVILYDETIRQQARDGSPFPEMVEKHGIIPGIKVDTGAKVLANSPDEKVTEGLDGLRERIAEYVQMGARFAKWRAVITHGQGMPTDYCIHTNAHALARYAALCQEGGLVPIVEPECLIDGDHSLERSYEVTEKTLRAVFAELAAQNVMLEGIVLKPSMVIAGKQAAKQSSVDEVAEWTIRVLTRIVPGAVPGVAFLSGGQTPQQSTAHLNAMNRLGPHPWQVTFSYARALQDAPMKIWKGDASKEDEAQKAFYARTKLVSLASQGDYTSEMEKEAA
ncbi:MAG: class I fructose-bisphosphate aldolase, partial [Gaiellales bacterium]